MITFASLSDPLMADRRDSAAHNPLLTDCCGPPAQCHDDRDISFPGSNTMRLYRPRVDPLPEPDWTDEHREMAALNTEHTHRRARSAAEIADLSDRNTVHHRTPCAFR